MHNSCLNELQLESSPPCCVGISEAALRRCHMTSRPPARGVVEGRALWWEQSRPHASGVRTTGRRYLNLPSTSIVLYPIIPAHPSTRRPRNVKTEVMASVRPVLPKSLGVYYVVTENQGCFPPPPPSRAPRGSAGMPPSLHSTTLSFRLAGLKLITYPSLPTHTYTTYLR